MDEAGKELTKPIDEAIGGELTAIVLVLAVWAGLKLMDKRKPKAKAKR